jgi:hypothetical protein
MNTNQKEAILGTMVFIRPAEIDYPPVEKHEEFGILDKMVKAGMKPIAIAKPELCCKLLLTSDEEVDDPRDMENDGLTKRQFSLVKKIVKGRSALKSGEVPVPDDQKSGDRESPEPVAADN